MGTANGLNRYDRNTDSFELITLPGLLLNGYIGQILEDSKGNIIFLASGIGLFSVTSGTDGKDDKVARRFDTFDSSEVDGTSISYILILNDGRLLIACRDGMYGIASGNRRFQKLGQLDSSISRANFEKSGDILLSTQYDVYRLNVKDLSLSKLIIGGGEKIKITDFAASRDATYFSTAWSGLWEVKTGAPALLRADCFDSSRFDFTSMTIGNVDYDLNGNLWLGCNSKGIMMLPARKSPFVSLSLNKILKKANDAIITCVNVVGDKVAVGLNTGYILILDSEGNLIRSVDAPGYNYVNSIVPEGSGKAFVGLVKDGIWSLDMETLTFSRVSPIDRHYAGIVLSRSGNGDLIAALSEVGIMKYNHINGEKIWYFPKEGSNLLSASYYAGICRTSDGRIWIGGYSGLSCYDPSLGELMPIDQSPFLDGVAYAVCDAGDGCVFIGTGTGLLKYHPEKGIIRKYTIHDGLADNDVRSLVRDYKGGVWIGTLKGLSYMADDDRKIRSYRGDIGLSKTSYVSSVVIFNRNRILLGGADGITFFNPDSVASSPFGARIRISAMFLNGEKVSPLTVTGNSKPIIEGDQYSPDALHLSYKDRSLVLRLSTMDFRDASGVRYEWQFDGDGDNWNTTPVGEHFLYLPALDPGKYTLRLRGWDNDVCSDISQIKLDITPPWYLSNMAYSVYAILGLIMIGLCYKVMKSKREEELNEARIKYFMDISHEIRSPITLLLNPIDALLKQKQSPETTAQLLTARRNAQRVLSLADQMLDLRKIEKGKMRLVYTPTNIRSFIEELVEMFRPQAEEKGLSIKFDCAKVTLWGEVDRDNLDKILVNLISNAIKYTPSGGEVVVSLGECHEGLGRKMYVVTVTDTGIGLDNKLISNIFERFYRGRENHIAGTSGFGIGLDLCMRLVELHKGSINAKNREDGVRGSVFSVTLPLNPVKPGVELSDEKTVHGVLPDIVTGFETSSLPSRPSSGHRFKVVVVDDDSELREYIKRNLGPAYKVVAVSDGEAALKEIGEKLPDIVVTDIKMEGINGLDLLRRIKGNMNTHHIPVILLSASAGSDERMKGWKSGADGYLAKPFSINELDSMISGLLSNRSKLKGIFSGTQKSVDNIAAPKVKGIDEELMDKINRYINDNLSEATMNVDGLSEYVGLSRSQLHRRMKDIVGVAPSDYIRNVKLRKACEMLAGVDVDISQVAYSLGFNAQSHFSTLFKRYTGVTPTEYRSLAKEGRLSEDMPR